MWLMLQQEKAEDFVIATGETYSVRQFLDEVFKHLDLDWHDYVETDPRYLRPTEVDLLLGDPTKAKQKLGWKPKVTMQQLAKMMIESDLELARKEAYLAKRK